MLDWFDVAPAVAFAVVAGGLARLVGGKPTWAVLGGVGYIVFAGLVAAAAATYAALDGLVGFAASQLATAILVSPLWLYVNASERTPVTDAEIAATVAEAEVILAQDPVAQETHDLFDQASFVRGHLEHILWRLPADADRRQQISDLCDRLQAWSQAITHQAKTRG